VKRHRSAENSSGRPAVLLDRDGTILDEMGYLRDPGSIRFLDGAVEGMRLLQRADYILLVVTNQSGIARGYFQEEDALAVNLRMVLELRAAGVKLDGIYHCPHLPDDRCSCRKPATGMLDRAVDDFDLDPGKCWIVGDAEGDVQMGRNGGLRTVMVLTGKEDKGVISASVPKTADLLEAARFILEARS